MMTDNEIIRSLECCMTHDCYECPNDRGNCEQNLVRYSLDLINRQKAEIEALQGNLKFVRGTVSRQAEQIEILSKNADTAFQDGLNEAQDLYAEQIKTEIKAEAIKEFAERLKKGATSVCSGHGLSSDMVYVGRINDLVKEMTGKDDVKSGNTEENH